MIGVAVALLQSAPRAQQRSVFRSGTELVLVNVVVRDKSGAVVKGLTADDFELQEDGVKQQILTFAYDEVRADAAPVESASMLGSAGASAGKAPSTAVAIQTPPVPSHPLTSDEVAGHRLITLLFDTNSMEPDDVQKAIDGATSWVKDRMTTADLVAVAAIGSSLQVLTDFTTSKEHVQAVLSALSAASGTAFAAVDSSTAASDDTAQSATDDSTAVDASAQELDTFNNDVRLRAIKTLADALQPIQQKKAILYFSAGLQRSGTDNQVELRAAVNAAVRANAVIYPVDARGLQAVVPGGSARHGGVVTRKLARAEDDGGFAGLHAGEEPRKMRLGGVNRNDLVHEFTSAWSYS
jgi:VWFA-related protein